MSFSYGVVWILCLHLFSTVCDPASLQMCTCSMSVPTQLCNIDGFSSISCFNLTATPPLTFKWSVLIYNTLINVTKKAVGLGDHCLTVVQSCMHAYTEQQPEQVLTFNEKLLARYEVLLFDLTPNVHLVLNTCCWTEALQRGDVQSKLPYSCKTVTYKHLTKQTLYCSVSIVI